MWHIAAKLLWAFEFSPPYDPVTGKEPPLDPDAYNPGLLQAPLLFKVQIMPRSEKHISTIKEERSDADGFMKQYQ
jgi:hypothetical protein